MVLEFRALGVLGFSGFVVWIWVLGCWGWRLSRAFLGLGPKPKLFPQLLGGSGDLVLMI